MVPVQARKNNTQNAINTFLNENFNLLVVFFVIVFLFVAYILLIRPKFQMTLMAVRDNISQQETFYQSQRQKLADLQAAATLYRKIDEADVEKVNSILPDEYAKEKLFGELEDIVLQRGLTLTSLALAKDGESAETAANPMAPKSERRIDLPGGEHIGVVTAEMGLGSVDYAGLKNLLPLLEQNLQLLDIRVMDFDPAAKTAVLSVDTYYFK
ncbi:MAG: hypothetical protein ACM3PZ_02060 [Bacillota bacterium]